MQWRERYQGVQLGDHLIIDQHRLRVGETAMHDPVGSARVMAAKELLDRGYGKVREAKEEPVAPLDVTPKTNSHEPPIRLEDFRKRP